LLEFDDQDGRNIASIVSTVLYDFFGRCGHYSDFQGLVQRSVNNFILVNGE